MSKRQTIKEINKRIEEYFGRLVKVTWGDAHGHHFIGDINNLTELAEIESVGWLIQENKEVVAVCSFKSVNHTVEYIEELKDKYRYYIVIPRKTIWRVRGL